MAKLTKQNLDIWAARKGGGLPIPSCDPAQLPTGDELRTIVAATRKILSKLQPTDTRPSTTVIEEDHTDAPAGGPAPGVEAEEWEQLEPTSSGVPAACQGQEKGPEKAPNPDPTAEAPTSPPKADCDPLGFVRHLVTKFLVFIDDFLPPGPTEEDIPYLLERHERLKWFAISVSLASTMSRRTR